MVAAGRYERLPQHSEALITWAAITLMTRRLTQPPVRLSRIPANGPFVRPDLPLPAFCSDQAVAYPDAQGSRATAAPPQAPSP